MLAFVLFFAQAEKCESSQKGNSVGIAKNHQSILWGNSKRDQIF